MLGLIFGAVPVNRNVSLARCDNLTDRNKLKRWTTPFGKKSKCRSTEGTTVLTQDSITQVYQLIEFLTKEQSKSSFDSDERRRDAPSMNFRYLRRGHFQKNGIPEQAARVEELVKSGDGAQPGGRAVQRARLCLRFEGFLGRAPRTSVNGRTLPRLLPHRR